MAVIKKNRNPLRTKTDKVRLGPLNATQLQSLYDKATGKTKDKIRRHMLNKKVAIV